MTINEEDAYNPPNMQNTWQKLFYLQILTRCFWHKVMKTGLQYI